MILPIVFILLITIGIGLPLTLWISPRHNAIGRLGLSYLLGIGLFTLLMYGANLLGFKITFINNLLLFLLFFIPLILFQREYLKKYWKELIRSLRNLRLPFVDKVLLGASGFFIASSFINTFYWPVYIWDALTLYDFRAKVFVQTGFIKSALAALGSSYYFGYPLLTSLSHAIVYSLGGNNPQFIYSLFYLSLGLVFYGLLREFVSRKLSLLFSLMLLTIPQIFNQSVISYTNLPYLTYFSLGVIYYFIWDRKRSPGYLVFSALLVGLSTWTRSTEPFWLAVFGIVFLTALYRRKILDVIVFSLIFFPVQQVWKNFQSSAGSVGSTLDAVTDSVSILSISNILNFRRWLEVITFLYRGVILTWGPLFMPFLVAFAYAVVAKKIKNVFLIYLIIFSLLVMFLIGTFILSFTFPAWSQIPDSASRTAMIFYPLFVYTVALTFFKEDKT